MTSVVDLAAALPIRAIKVRAGTPGNCGGVVVAVVDLEPGPAGGVELDTATAEFPDGAGELPDIVEEWIEDFAFGLREALHDRCGAEPPVRVVVHRMNGGWADGNKYYWRRAGRMVVDEAFRIAAG